MSFLDAEPGVIAMLVDDTAGTDADPDRDGVLVVLNATPSATTVAADAVTVPARTTAVFER